MNHIGVGVANGSCFFGPCTYFIPPMLFPLALTFTKPAAFGGGAKSTFADHQPGVMCASDRRTKRRLSLNLRAWNRPRVGVCDREG